MQELVKVQKEIIGNSEVNAVSARAIWEMLGSKKKFPDWSFNKLVNNSFFMQGVDWEVFDKSIINPINKGGRPQKDYIITLETAKRLAMMEQTAKGEEVRTYFIECEEKLKQVIQQPVIELPYWAIEGKWGCSFFS